ncbi:hypothetical protein BU16DRAFT_619117 [Lophium mytilinum]|uniref:DRBM domain-containing protein n=1 Tax=Lophium mytilinum TaxID=390894 RepID=A0A6A6QND1_9PEZI|nr:hypothetical protein BU16DRAFT_619117 [Lophium mytilinum]
MESLLPKRRRMTSSGAAAATPARADQTSTPPQPSQASLQPHTYTSVGSNNHSYPSFIPSLITTPLPGFEKRKMEVATPLASQNSTHAPPSTDQTRSLPGAPSVLQNLLSIDEFEKQHEAAVAAAKAQAQSTPTPQPIPISTRSSANTQLFVQRCQALAIPQPIFSFNGDASLPSWNCTLTLHAAGSPHSLTTTSPFTSKKEAKEAASTLGLALLSSLEASGTLSTPSKTKKRTPTPTPITITPEEPQENFTGILMEFCQASKIPVPTFAEFKTGTCFSAELSLASHRPEDGPFGGRAVLHPSKKAARAAAAREAVLWLRAQGQLPAVHEPASAKKQRKTAGGSEDAAVQLPAHPAAARVLALASELGLPQPEYQWAAPSALAPGLFTVSSLFPGSGVGGEDGVVATARHVFGKKAAREECARLTVVELEGVLERRRGVLGKVLGNEEGKREVEMGEGDEEYHSC